ncbi:MAG: (Fe-S)-binding protein [Myxococcota bacterium]
MRVALFVPCYVDQLCPDAGWAALELLEELGVQVDFPKAQTCCGQPMWTAGARAQAAGLAQRFLDVFDGWDRVVAPSASCVATVRRAFAELVEPRQRARAAAMASRCFELTEFIVDELGVGRIDRAYPHRVGLHQGCHGLRELRLGRASERREETRDPARQLLASLHGIELVPLERADECCGFGGQFAVTEAPVSSLMGRDRLLDHERAGAGIVTSTDASCLLHLDGLARRAGSPLRMLHVAEVLMGREPAS